MRFERTKFWNAYRDRFGSAKQSVVDAIEFLLGQFERDATWKNVPEISYAMGTIRHETAGTFEPIVERGPKSYFDKYDAGTRIGKRLGNVTKGDGYKYRGRGYVQLTGLTNYKKYGLENMPEKALDPQTAYRVMTDGMHSGLYTGKRLSDFIHGDVVDYIHARTIINGMDKAAAIAGYAHSFEQVLTSSTVKPSDLASDISPGTNGRTTSSPSIDSAADSPERTDGTASDEHAAGDSTDGSPRSSQEQPPITQQDGGWLGRKLASLLDKWTNS